jgi:hypothetical protein
MRMQQRNCNTETTSVENATEKIGTQKPSVWECNKEIANKTTSFFSIANT